MRQITESDHPVGRFRNGLSNANDLSRFVGDEAQDLSDSIRSAVGREMGGRHGIPSRGIIDKNIGRYFVLMRRGWGIRSRVFVLLAWPVELLLLRSFVVRLRSLVSGSESISLLHVGSFG
jgi:hypothetical protein